MAHLDANFLVDAVREGAPEQTALRRLNEERIDVAMSVVAWAEFRCGPLSAEDLAEAESMISPPIPLLQIDAELGARLFNLTGRRSRSLADCLIAAVAIRCDVAFLTNNLGDFRPVVPFGLRLI